MFWTRMPAKSLHSGFEVLTVHSSARCCLCYTTRSRLIWHATKRERRKGRMEEVSRGRAKGGGGRWQQWQLVIVLMKTRTPLSLLHILSLPLVPTLHSLFVYLSLPLSLSPRPKIMRSLPSQGPFHIKTLSSLPVSRTLTLCPHPVFHATGLLLATPILGHALSLQPPLPHTKRFPSDPIYLIVNEKGKLNSFDLSRCVHCTLPCVYIYLCLCKNVLACLKIPFKTCPIWRLCLFGKARSQESIILY